MPDPTGNDAQGDPRKHIGIVSLTGNKGPAIFQSHILKGTSTGKDPSALDIGKKRKWNLETGLGQLWQAILIS